uniref:Peptidase_M13 domain-containing protein n=1 Tax=Caenorhabditis japonica TaxID=281687 RepID=A0A8R1E630_CAEJA
MPKVAGFAGIGSIIGHEIGHGFDRGGARHNSDGNIQNWWHPKDRKEFSRREKCVIDQYENYDDPSFGKNLNGTTTAAENVADLLGTTAIWNAYNDLNAEEKEIYIVGLEDYSSDKLFFHIRAAVITCIF